MTNKELDKWLCQNEKITDDLRTGGSVVPLVKLEALFKGMKLVPEDSIVLSREHADALAWPVGLPYKEAERAQTALKEAIQAVEGAKKDEA